MSDCVPRSWTATPVSTTVSDIVSLSAGKPLSFYNKHFSSKTILVPINIENACIIASNFERDTTVVKSNATFYIKYRFGLRFTHILFLPGQLYSSIAPF